MVTENLRAPAAKLSSALLLEAMLDGPPGLALSLEIVSQVIAVGSHSTKLLRLLPVRISGEQPVTACFASIKHRRHAALRELDANGSK